MVRRKDGAVTHADLETGRRSRELGSKMGTAVVVFALLCGLVGFVFCALAECSRSKGKGELVLTGGGKSAHRCVDKGNGRVAFLHGVGGSISLAIGLFVLHAYMWVAIHSECRSRESPVQMHSNVKSAAASKQAAIFFLIAWCCFGVAEVMLVIGMAVESRHFKRWRDFGGGCVATPHWLFLAAGVFELLSVFLATGFYLLMVKIERLRDWELAVAREVMEARRNLSGLQVLNSSIISIPSSHQAAPAREEVPEGKELCQDE